MMYLSYTLSSLSDSLSVMCTYPMTDLPLVSPQVVLFQRHSGVKLVRSASPKVTFFLTTKFPALL